MAEIERLEGKDLPVPTLRLLLGALRQVANKVRDNIEEYAESLTEYERDAAAHRADPSVPKPFPLARAQLHAAAGPLVVLHLILQIFDKSDSSRIPFELVRAFERFTSELLDEEIAFLFKPTRAYDYSVLDVHKRFAQRHRVWEPFKQLKPHAFLVEFPAAEASSVLLHTLLYHELGHTYFTRRVDKERLLELVNSTLPGAAASARSALYSWVEEIFCDLFALRLTGPAFLCAFQFFGDPFLNELSMSPSHPGFATRRRALFDYGSRLASSYPEMGLTCALFGDYCRVPSSEAVCDEADLAGTPLPEEDPTMLPAIKAVVATDSDLWKYVFEKLDECATPFRHPGMTKSIERAVEQVGALVPPVVRPLPAGWGMGEMLAVAFCAAWLFRIERMCEWTDSQNQRECQGWSETRAQRALGDILLAGVEGGELELRYRDHRRIEAEHT
ncbi:hypothetical protein [Sorangium sp. So ce1182]|uniref:hypothetical protein n=1 Tax=Sorangium sp. So ce1182 TaxID=3133334 RepID=UPI003F617A6B